MAARIPAQNNGPIRIEGELEIVDPSGAPFGLAGRTTISLCRCGHSVNSFSDQLSAISFQPSLRCLG
jgi:hypothetical protein